MTFGRFIFCLGVALVLLGALLNNAPQALAWFGKLPGDLRFGGDNVRLYIPITSMLVVSAVLSAAAFLVQYLLGGR